MYFTVPTCKLFFLVASGLVLAAKAYQITTPTDVGTSSVSWTSTGPNAISWQRVSTDPTSFSIVLVNEDRSLLPTNNQLLASSVDGNVLSIAVSPPSGQPFPVGPGFRVNFVKGENDLNTIYAQSSQFRIVPDGNDVGGTVSAGASSMSMVGSSTRVTNQMPHSTYVAPAQTETVTMVINSANFNSPPDIVLAGCFLSFLFGTFI